MRQWAFCADRRHAGEFCPYVAAAKRETGAAGNILPLSSLRFRAGHRGACAVKYLT